MIRSHTSHDGFGLVELMIALGLGLLLTTAVLQVTLASQRSQHLLEAAARLQESGRYAMNLLTKDIRTAGYMGCPNLRRTPVNVIADDPPDDFDFSPAGVFKGFDNIADDNPYRAVAGSDVVVLQRAALPSARLIDKVNPGNASIQIDANPAGLGRNDFVFITDCVNADVFKAASVSANNNNGNDSATIVYSRGVTNRYKLSKIYGLDTQIMGFQSLAYYVRDTRRVTARGAPIYSLYVSAREFGSGAAPAAMELVEGVEDMQLTYGVDTDDDRSIDSYRTAADVGDWTTVMSVRIELLMQSLEDNVAAANGDFAQDNLQFNGSGVTADGRLRQVYSSVVAIRNRLP